MKFAFKNIHEFNEYFKDEATCYSYFEQLRWEGKPICPHCGSEKFYKVKARGKFQDIPSYRCGNRECDLPFTVRTKSIFEGSKVALKTWFQAFYEISTRKKGTSSVELGTRLGCSQKTAWFINHRIRAMLKETEPTLLQDVVAFDETYVGGKEGNKHANKKTPGAQGRSSKTKTMVFGGREYTGKVKAQIVPDADQATVIPLIREWVRKNSMVVSDEWKGYAALDKGQLSEEYLHVTVNHLYGEYVKGGFTINGIENFWSCLKRGIIGVFHSVSPQHLQAYVDEFADRYNKKDLSNAQRFEENVQRAPNARLKYWQVTNKQHLVRNYLNYRADTF